MFKPSRSASSSAAVAAVVLETLERRQLLAATLTGGLLTVAGTAKNDSISIFVTPGSAGSLSVKQGTSVLTFSRSAIQGLLRPLSLTVRATNRCSKSCSRQSN